MGALHDALEGKTKEERRAIKNAAFANLGIATREWSVRGFTITVMGKMRASDKQTLRLWVRVVRDSDDKDFTPEDINPIDVVNPPYLVEDPTGDVELHDGTGPVMYREDLEYHVRQIIKGVLQNARGV